jgi:hypothetical protein
MARFILLTIVAFVAITFLFVALKGILRRLSGVSVHASEDSKGKKQDKRILYEKEDVVVLQGEAKDSTTPYRP